MLAAASTILQPATRGQADAVKRCSVKDVNGLLAVGLVLTSCLYDLDIRNSGLRWFCGRDNLLSQHPLRCFNS